MRVCLVNPPDRVVADALWDEPLGLLYLAAVLEERWVDVEVVDLNLYDDLSPLSEVKADYFGVYCSSSLLDSALRVNQFIMETHPKAMRLVGGPHATCMPDDLSPHFDKVIIGEGERAIIEIMAGAWPTKLVRSATIEDLDCLPYPARHLVPINNYHRTVDGVPSTGLITSRGCPHNCAFCSKVWGNRVRFRSAENVIGEVAECVGRYGINAFSIRDDTFTLHRKRLFKILDGFKRLDVVWRCLTRVDQVDKTTLSNMGEAGCVEIVYGIENGSQTILDNLNKGTTVEQNREAIRLTKEAGINTKAAVIVGSPGETWDTIRDTMHFIEDNPPDSAIVCLFTPYPGSPVWDDPQSFGMKILTRDVSKYAAVGPDMVGNVVVETEEMTADDIREAHQMVLRRFRELGLVPEG